MKADILKRLLQTHVEGDEQGFRKAALQLAATEGNSGHTRIAEELRAIIAQMPVPPGPALAAMPGGAPGPTGVRVGASVDIAQPRGDLAGLLTGGYRTERRQDIVLSPATSERIERILREYRHRSELAGWGVSPSRKLLFHGPPGCGKTLAASVVAGELGLPMMTVRFDGLFSRFLGATAAHLKVIFDEMPRRPAVYLFDEFDAVAKSRGDSHEVGEIRRVVTSFLQLIDADQSASIVIAATNFDELLDRAVFRRFDLTVPFALPTAAQLDQLIQLRLRAFALSSKITRRVAARAVGLSFADAARACDDSIKGMVLDGRRLLEPEDLEQAFETALARGSRVSASRNGPGATQFSGMAPASVDAGPANPAPKPRRSRRNSAPSDRPPTGSNDGSIPPAT